MYSSYSQNKIDLSVYWKVFFLESELHLSATWMLRTGQSSAPQKPLQTGVINSVVINNCLLNPSDAADELTVLHLGGYGRSAI